MRSSLRAVIGSSACGGFGQAGESSVNIILVSSNLAKTRTITLSWKHYAFAVLVGFILMVGLTTVLNYGLLRYATAINHPWLQAIILSDQRKEAERAQVYMEEHLAAMALKVGELQGQLLRLDGLGEKLAKIAGLKPQELPAKDGGRGGPAPTSQKAWTLEEFSAVVQSLSKMVDARTDQLSVLEALLVQDSVNKKFLPSYAPVDAVQHTSNFGNRIDPFTGLMSFHEGIDFHGDKGTAVLAAASGKVMTAEWHPAYGKMVEIDHGNGLVSRYAHASRLDVKEGELVVRGQKIAEIGSTGRSTGPHLHFEVRLNGVPQNPARFLRVDG
jgi:murein DD-endopeptidase MepM/ murein hydrolase activator NlpD